MEPLNFCTNFCIDWKRATYNNTLECHDQTSDFIPVHGLLNLILPTIMISFSMILWSKIFISCAAIVALVYYQIYRPSYYFRDLTGIKRDTFFEIDSAGITAKQRLMNRMPKRASVLNTPMYPNGWFSLCESSMVGKKNVKHIVALGNNFAIFRTSNGKVHVVDACCHNWGANFGAHGMVKNDRPECPLHGWQFEGNTGKFNTRLIISEEESHFPTAREWRSCEVNHIIFVWYHAEGEGPMYEIQPIDEVMSGRYWFVGKIEHLLNNTVQETLENLADTRHFEILHSPLSIYGSNLGPIPEKLMFLAKVKFSAKWWPDSAMPHESWTKVDGRVRILDKFNILSGKTKAQIIGPGYVVFNVKTTFGNAKLMAYYTPIGALSMRAVTLVYTHPRTMIIGQLFMNFSLVSETERDFMVQSYKKLESKANTVKEDGPITQYRRWFSQFFSKNSPRLKIQTDTLSL